MSTVSPVEVFGLTIEEFVKLVVTAHMAGWRLEEDSLTLGYATMKRFKYAPEALLIFDGTNIEDEGDDVEKLAGFYGNPEPITEFSELLEWVANK